MDNNKGVEKNKFQNQKTILSAHFGSDCKYIDSYAFNGCSSLIEINKDNSITEIRDNAFSGTGILHATFKKVTSIGKSAFQDCENLESIDIPNCQTIGGSAFQDCKNLKSVDISFCNTIGSNAFNACENISQISLLNCDKISNGGFFNCENLKKVYIYSDSCVLGENVFYKGEGDNTSIIDGIVFYFKPNMYSEYLKDATWEPYIDHMVTMADEKNIIYKSTTGYSIEIIDNLNNINTNEYNICGILNFNEPITSLGKIFLYPDQLSDIDFPPTCAKIEPYAFEGCSNLTNIILPEDLQIIGEYAFKGCSNFTTITIPQYVNELGEGIFAGCSNLKTFYGKFATYGGKAIVYNNTLICVSPNDDSETGGRIHDISKIDKNITRLGNSCFSYCKELRRVNIPKNVTTIGKDIFIGCKNLQEVHFYGEPPTIEDNTDWLGLGSDSDSESTNDNVKIFVPEKYITDYLEKGFAGYNIYPRPDSGVIYYYDSNFSSDSKQSNEGAKLEYTIDNKTQAYYLISNIGTKIDSKYFQNNKGITHVILSDNINKIGSEAFDSCVNLKYIYIPDSITNIGYKCFRNCTSLERIHIPYGTHSNEESLGNSIFTGCTSLKEFGTYYKDYVSKDNRCYIRDGILKFFAQSSDSKEYKISNTNIHTIGECAFESTNISRIELNDSIKTIAPYAFYGCTELREISGWNNVITISEYAFNRCKNLGNINNDSDSDSDISYITSLPERLEKIDEFAFSNCSNLNISEIPTNVSYIGEYAFAGTGCESIDLSQTKITQINKSTFKNCEKLSNIVLSENISYIGDSAFESAGCESIDLSQTKITQINKSTFKDCAKLGSIVLSENITSIGESAFENCKELDIDISIAKNLETIGAKSFKKCKMLSNNKSGTIKLPNKVQTIENSAFYGCSCITTIKLPANLKSIGVNGLYTDSETLLTVYVHSATTNPPILTFEGKNGPFGSSTLYVGNIYIPTNIKSNYINVDGWKKYKSKITSIDVDTLESYINQIEYSTTNKSIVIYLKNLPEDNSWEGGKVNINAGIDSSKLEYSLTFTIPSVIGINTISLLGIDAPIKYIKIVNIDNVDIQYSGEIINVTTVRK